MAVEDDAWYAVTPIITSAELQEKPCACQYDWNDPTVLSEGDAACLGASSVLYLLSGRTAGGYHPATISPVPLGSCSQYVPPPDAVLAGRVSRPRVEDHWTGYCPASIYVLDAPVLNVQDITVDGVTVADSDWSVLEYRYLVHEPDVDGNHVHWPTDRRRVVVTYSWGKSPPSWAKEAAYELACRFMSDALENRPKIDGVTSASGGGLTWSRARRVSVAEQIAQSVRMMPDDFPAVNRFVGIVNPTLDPNGGGFMWSPDVPIGGARVTG